MRPERWSSESLNREPCNVQPGAQDTELMSLFETIKDKNRDEIIRDLREHYNTRNMQTVHLTLTGPLAGQTLCGVSRKDAAESGHLLNHAQWAPLVRDDYRAQCCRECLLVWAESYDESEQRPEWATELLAS